MLIDWVKAAGFVALLAVALAGALHWALYYPPSSYLPFSGETQAESQETSTQSSPSEPRGTHDAPLVVKVLPPAPGTPEATERRREQNQKLAADRALLWFTAVLSVATLALMIATVGLVFLAKQQADDARVRERAYIKMSHALPGVDFEGGTGKFTVKIGMKNVGRTPANITDFLLKPIVHPRDEELPTIPDYLREKQRTAKAFVVSDEEVFLSEPYSIAIDEENRVKAGTVRLWIIGYVDYIDRFGYRHRGGYARHYWPQADDRTRYGSDAEFEKRNNLSYVPQPGYNYDRLRQKGEGDDWGET
jgi:hypothetical protein